MSREGGQAGSGRRDGASSNVPSQPFPPQFYPVVGYQGPPHAWFPPHPSAGVPAQWSPPWRPSMGYPTPTPPWSSQQTPTTTIAPTTVTTAPSDEYTVDTLRRIYKDDDGRVEIQRVKVQRRHPETGAVSVTGPEAMSVVPVGSIPQNERRPPPRKHRRKQEIHLTAMGPTGPYPWYPYMPYMPYPYQYPYYLAGCMWPPGAPSDSLSTWSSNEGSEAVSSRQDSALNSQRLESRASHLSRDSLSSALHRSSSPAAASHITDSHSLAPSDSVSVRGRKRETSLERALRGPTPPPRTKSRASSSLGCKSDDAGKTQEWMLEMQRALRTRGDAGVKARDKGALSSDNVDVYKKIPPIRKRRKMKADDMSDRSSMTDVSERQSVVSEGMFDDSSRLSSELNYAFRKLERSVDAFKTGIAADPSPIQSHAASPSVEIDHSSGDITPIETHVTPLPLSDIRGLAEKAKEEEIKRRKEYGRPRAISESISSLPSLETAKVGSTPDVSFHPNVTVISSSQLTPSAQTSTVRVTPNTTCPSPPAAASTTSTAHTPASTTEKDSIETTEVTSKTEAVLDAPGESPSSTETADASDSTVIHSPKTSTLTCQPSSPPHSSQGQLLTTTTLTTEATAKETETGVTKVPAEQDSPPAVELTGTPAEKLAEDSTTITSTPTTPTGFEGVGDASGRHSQASSATTFFSVRTADDSHHALDTDSTDIPLPTTDSATADENEDSPGSPGPEDDHLWVLQRPEEAPTLNTAGQDERRNAWRAEVSLWRARLVVSLCRGRGLDRQDWATLHLMVHHPLTLDLKLSLLHAPRLCAANSSMGPAVLRVALIQLAQYGEILLQPEASRQPGWRSVRLDAAQAWTPVKGASEILQSLGYQERRGGVELRYKRRCSPEASVVARLTLDMLVLAEEFRLFLTGTHQYPNNVSSLFFTESLATSAVPDLPQRPPSSEGSFVSAQSETVPAARPQSEASSVTDEDTETLQTCGIETKSHSKLSRNRSTSEEDVTLREDENKSAAVENVSTEIKELKTETTQQIATETDVKTPLEGFDKQQLPEPASDLASISSDVTSPPDLQSIHSTTVSPECQRPSGLEVTSDNETITHVTTPVISEVNSASKVDEDNPVTTSPVTPAATNDNPEEHVYEEIDVIRAQVQSLRASSVPTESAPPPLPPKKKISSGGEDDSGLNLTYPHMEWSSASTPGSLRGGSTGARRKKRRAPMPPEFLQQNWKESQEAAKKEDPEATAKTQVSKGRDTTKKSEYRRSLNPFYEEIDNVEDDAKETENNKEDKLDNTTVNGNPFLENTAKATGYIGKNPFYDDVEILKKSDEYTDMKTKQSSPAAPTAELTPTTDTISAQQSDAPAVRPKRRAPRPPPTPEALVTHTANHPVDSTSPQPGKDKVVVSSVLQSAEERQNESKGNDEVTVTNGIEPPCKQTSQRSSGQIDITSSLSVSSDNPEGKKEAELEAKLILNKDIKTDTVEEGSSVPLPPANDHQARGTEAARITTPKQSRATRASLSHPKAPPPPPPTPTKSPANIPSTENLVKALKEDSPPPVPPPKAPLSLLDEIPYMDANEVKEARAQSESLDSNHHVVTSDSPAATVKFSPILSRQPSLTLAHVNDADIPPQCPPPPPPCPPPESPPETPHTSPPDTPHTSPPETPHTSPPETPHASLPATPRLSPKGSPLPPPRHQLQASLSTKEKYEVQAPPVPPKTTQLESLDGEPPTKPPSLSMPPKVIQQKDTLHPQKASSAVHSPVTETHSVQSSTSEERYEIPDTSRAPPPRPPIPTPPKTQQQQQVNGKTPAPLTEEDRYEVPEAPKHAITGVLKESRETVKTPEAEERYEIPEVVKDTPLKRGVNGVSCTVALGRTSSPRRGEIAAVFGPPKPPRRRRNNHSPPPRPPKNLDLIDGTRPDGLSEAAHRPPSTTSSFTSSSSGPPPASLQHKKTPKRRSWPFLLCDCLYVNCRTYEDADK